jgi:hypothetical protein
MASEQIDPGRLLAVHPVAPVYVQRAIFVAILSFLFFLAMMFAFYLRQNFLYFLLATAFLLVYLITMFSWFTQRNAAVKVYENGFDCRKRFVKWDEIESISDDTETIVKTKTGQPMTLSPRLAEKDALVRHLKYRLSAHGEDVPDA